MKRMKPNDFMNVAQNSTLKAENRKRKVMEYREASKWTEAISLTRIGELKEMDLGQYKLNNKAFSPWFNLFSCIVMLYRCSVLGTR